MRAADGQRARLLDVLLGLGLKARHLDREQLADGAVLVRGGDGRPRMPVLVAALPPVPPLFVEVERGKDNPREEGAENERVEPAATHLKAHGPRDGAAVKTQRIPL